MRHLTVVAALVATVPASAVSQAYDDRYRPLPHFGLQFFSVDRAAVFGGVTYRPSFETGRRAFWAVAAGAQVGVAGGALNIGLARHLRPVISDVGGIGSDISVKGQLAYLRTWGDPAHVGPRQAFLGPEIQVMWSIVGVRVGFFERISGQSPGDASFLTIGLVLGWH
jgi:hypothetical protein